MKYKRLHKGFSLIELLLSIVIVGIVTVVVGEILVQGYDTFTVAQDVSNTDWEGLLILENITNDVHNIRSAQDISSATSSSFAFTDMSGTSVTYSLSGTTALRNGVTLGTGISSLAFTYYDANGSTTTTASAVRYVALAITVAKNNLSQSYSTLASTRGME